MVIEWSRRGMGGRCINEFNNETVIINQPTKSCEWNLINWYNNQELQISRIIIRNKGLADFI